MSATKVKSLISIAKAMEEQMGMFNDYIDSTIKDIYGLDPSIKDVIEKLSIEDIEKADEDDIFDYLSIGFDGEGDNPNITAIEKGCEDNKEYPTVEKYAKYIFKEIKDILNKREELSQEKNKLTTEINEYTNKWFDYIDSSEYREKNLARIKELREKAENETDPEIKRKTLKLVRSFEDAESLGFLFSRFENMKGKEVANIKDIFFNNKRSSIVVSKFNKKMKAYGYNANFYKLFFDLEEKFLPEKYRYFNNLFLFIVMRYIGYTDSDNKADRLNVAVLVRRLYNLVYHKFDKDDREKEFVSIITKIDDYFMDYKEDFKEKNITHYEHPVRIKTNKEYDEKQKAEIIKILKEAGFDDDFEKYTLKELKEKAIEYTKEKRNEVEQEEGEDEAEIPEKTSEEEDETFIDEGENNSDDRGSQDEEDDVEYTGDTGSGFDAGTGTDSDKTESGGGETDGGESGGTESGSIEEDKTKDSDYKPWEDPDNFSGREDHIEYDEDGNLLFNVPDSYILEFTDEEDDEKEEEESSLLDDSEIQADIESFMNGKRNSEIEESMELEINHPEIDEVKKDESNFDMEETEESDLLEEDSDFLFEFEDEEETTEEDDSLRAEKWNPKKEDREPKVSEAMKLANHYSVPETPRNVLEEKTNTEEDTSEIEIYVDMKGNYYIEDGDDTYAYCDHENNVLQESIDEMVVIRLYSSGNLKKSKLTL